MKKYLIAFMLVVCSAVYAEGTKTDTMLGERNSTTTSDPCQAPSVVGCGPCFKACMAQHHSDVDNEKTSSSPKKAPSRGGKSGSSAQ